MTIVTENLQKDPAAPASPSALTKELLVSIVIPCRNEVNYIGHCLDSIIASSYPQRLLEVLVVDGMSADGTRSLLRQYVQQHSFIKIIDNPNLTTPHAFNAGIRKASGDLIIIMSAHATYQSEAIARSVRYSEEYGADNVGGIWVMHPRDEGLVARAITIALSHRFGVGGALYRIGGGKSPRWADTAAYGCYRKDVFERIGLFNERLAHGQDMEFNRRLRQAGGRTLLAPDIEIHYSARSDLKSFIRHTFRNGLWVILPFLYSDIMPVSARHLVPLCFVLSLMGSLALAVTAPWAGWLATAIACSYGVICLSVSTRLAVKSKEPRLLFVMPPIFCLLHSTYGIGSIWGLLKAPFLALSAPARPGGRAGYDALKRAFDFTASLFGLLILGMPLCLIALAIKLDSPGPVFYRGLRVGLNGRPMRIFKFRTMVVDAERKGGPSTADGDPRITRLGRFLRKLKLDELPQLLNVFVGDMSFVGPRPEVPIYVNLYTEEEKEILTALPGITDLATLWNPDEGALLAGAKDAEKEYLEKIRPNKIRLQLEYVRNRSFLMDLRIVLRTIAVVAIKGSRYGR